MTIEFVFQGGEIEGGDFQDGADTGALGVVVSLRHGEDSLWEIAGGGWWLVVGGWWLVVGGWWKEEGRSFAHVFF